MAVGQVSFHSDKKVCLHFCFSPSFYLFTFFLGQTRCFQSHLWNPDSELMSMCYQVYVEKRENPIVNRLNKTKEERLVDHEQERLDRIKKENAVKRAAAAEKVPCVTPRTIHYLLIQVYQLTRKSKTRNWPRPGKLRKLPDPMTRYLMLKKTKMRLGRLGESWKRISCNFKGSLFSRHLVKM